MQSPLRAGILRFLSARPDEAFDVEALMQTFGRMRLDVENCVNELVDFGVVRQIAGDPPTLQRRRGPSRGRRRRAARHLPRAPRRPSAPRTSRRRCSASAR